MSFTCKPTFRQMENSSNSHSKIEMNKLVKWLPKITLPIKKLQEEEEKEEEEEEMDQEEEEEEEEEEYYHHHAEKNPANQKKDWVYIKNRYRRLRRSRRIRIKKRMMNGEFIQSKIHSLP